MNQDGLYQPIDYDGDSSSDISGSISVLLSDPDITTPPRCSPTGSGIPSLKDEDDDQLRSPVQMSPIENSCAEVFSEGITLTVERLARLSVEDDVTPGTVSDHWSVTSWVRSQIKPHFTSPTALGRQPGTATSEAEDTEWGLEDFREFSGAEEALSEDLWVVAPPAWQVDTPDRRLPPTLVQFVLQHERTRVRFLRREWGHRFRITISGQRAVTISKCYQKE
ncbi:uncharacterized protein LOC127012491 [Drosophila biarmipes]|uniref:uncharacterized protein LOC127012491 n=1 Tax=Drosophila biarmipes TaxID=125945 RepID=UPI0021CCF185|nr:uncharacterized protein LOC108028875 isoform X3 [Drosophila biarmipes]XP_050746404.1 uncharacterized protein LOC127012491 [Drosophila biarmipes]